MVAVYSDHVTLSLATATFVVDQARRAVRTHGRFRVAVAGGSTPAVTYQFLGTAPFVGAMPWSETEIFWTDERCVDAEDPRSNERMVREALLDRVPVQPDHIHPMRCGIGGGEGRWVQGPEAAAAAQTCAHEYEALLMSTFPAEHAQSSSARATGRVGVNSALDLVLLGVGTDGHTASLFPGTMALRDERAATAVFAEAAANTSTSAGDSDLWRITMTASFINRANCVVFLVSGSSKAAVAREILQGPADPIRLPAQLIDPDGLVVWHMDEEAAALLDGTTDGG